jgi:uncharacterized phage protein (TIGR01671 family)
MREIKFRAWDGEVMSDPFTLGDVSDGLVYQGCAAFGYEAFDIVDKEIMQYTGIKDKNGKEIYEGDVIRLVYIHDEGGGWKSNSNEIGKVYFDTTWGVKFDCVDHTQRTADSHWKLKKSTFRDACDVEIIGNIYENPELIGA